MSRWSARRTFLVVGAVAAVTALSVAQGIQQHVGNDFHVFWQAGRNFTTGSPLYHDYLPGARQFKYPPFAALLFQLLGVFPLRVAAVLFSMLNLGLWVAAVYLIRDIVTRTFPDRNPAPLPLLLAAVFSAQFFLDNFHHVQMNGAVFVLVLLGIRAHLLGRNVWAAASLVAATAIKLTPIFFVLWLLVRGRPRASLAVPPLALACLLLPLLVRGPTTGVAELREYYHSFIEGHQRGEVSTYHSNQNLGAL
ncbi:MAG: glycosyltransferase family 87 protein, partial [Gemmatimonadales bacterium]